MRTDTIAAIATAFSEAGIGIIRISGAEAFTIVDRIFVGKRDFREFQERKNEDSFQKTVWLKDAEGYTLHYGFIVDGRVVVDEVLVSVMRAPRSYTAEDVAEINCHGGILVLQKVLELVIRHGARVAEPGEFTKRAFLNGRMDLSEAEAVMDLIQSKNEFALQASALQLRGSVSSIIKGLRSRIIYEIAFIESAIDDPENYDTEGYGEKLFGILDEIGGEIGDLISHADDGRILKEGIQTVILGKPNAGKSSFLNELLGEERAIVTDIPGTTRDALEENIMLGGISLRVIDTAGIRNTEDKVERIGVDKARQYAAQADLILYIVDSSVDLDESDEEIFEILRDKRFIVLLNKSDLDMAVTEREINEKFKKFLGDKNSVSAVGKDNDFRQINFVSGDGITIENKTIFGNKDILENNGVSVGKALCENDMSEKYEVIRISALEHQGMEEFEKAVRKMFLQGEVSFNNEVIITSMRHKEALLEAAESISMVKRSIEDGLSEDFYSIDLMNAYAALGRIIGEEVGDDLVNEIFEKFCMGK